VTQSWWDFLWLSEGLSSYYEYFGVDEVYPEMRAMELMQVHVCQLAMDLDSYETTRPINYGVEDRIDIELLFYDRISHDKGKESWQPIAVYNQVSSFAASCVLKMVQHVLTKDVFSEGLSAFLSRL
jgi:aminopeptidase N